MKLADILRDIDCKYDAKYSDLEIKNIRHNSQQIEEGSLFIAIKGHTVDGHRFIQNAIENGAVAVIGEWDVEKIGNVQIAYIQVKSSESILADISSAFFENPSKSLDVFGITGTNGKTTTSYLLKYVLESKQSNVGLIGTTGCVIDGVMEKSSNTTPDALVLQSIFNRMVKSQAKSCVMEVSSHALKLERVKNTNYKIGIFTNLTPEHLDFHPNMEDYYLTKKKLFEMTSLANIINIDDIYGKRLVNEINNRVPIYSYGVEEEADFRAINIENRVEGLKYTVKTPKGNYLVEMKIAGRVNIYNSLAVIAAAYSYGYDMMQIIEALQKAENVPGRFEFVETNDDYHVLIDYAHTPDGYEKLFSTVNEFAKGRKIALFGCGGDRDGVKRPVMGEIAARNCDLVILTTDNPRTENPDRIVEDILIGIKKANGNYLFIEDRKEAIEYAIENHQPNDLIMLIGKGHERYQIIGHEKHYFNEREIVETHIQRLKGEK